MLHPNAYATYMKLVAAVNLLYTPGRLKHGIHSYTFISINPEPFTLQYSSMHYRKVASKRTGMRKQQPCVTLRPKGNLVQLPTNIDLLRGPVRPPFFSLSTLTLSRSPLRTAERARMPETALLSAFSFFFPNSGVKVLFFGRLDFLLPLSFKLLLFGNTIYYLDTVSFRYLRNGPSFLRFPFTFCMIVARSFHHNTRQGSQPDDLSLAHHIIISSAPPRSAQQRYSSAAQR